MGFTDEREIFNQIGNDYSLQVINYYQARINSYINLMENVEMARYIQSWDYLFGIVATLPGGLEALGRK